MANHGRSGLVWFALATVLFLLVAGCNGFFVNPSLTAVAVSPAAVTLTQEVGTPPTCPAGSICTQQMSAIATFSDGTTSTVAASWTTSDMTIATVTNSGLVTAVGAGSATITAASGTLTGTGSVQVTLANLISIQISPATPTVHLGQGTQQFKALGTFSGGGGQQDITSAVTWMSTTISPAGTTVATISNAAPTNGLATLDAAGTTTIAATSGNISNSTTLTVVSP